MTDITRWPGARRPWDRRPNLLAVAALVLGAQRTIGPAPPPDGYPGRCRHIHWNQPKRGAAAKRKRLRQIAEASRKRNRH